MGGISSLLCCAGNSDTSSNKAQQAKTRAQSSPPSPRREAPASKAPASVAKASDTKNGSKTGDTPAANKILETVRHVEMDDSTNESDTITNTPRVPPASAPHGVSVVPEEHGAHAPDLELELLLNALLNDSDASLAGPLDLTRPQVGQVLAPNGWLLEAPTERFAHKKCLVLDLDETLVHSLFKYLRQADFVIPVEIDDQVHSVYVIKRPGVDEFIKRVGELYEVVVFTALVLRYGDPLLDHLDPNHDIHHRLFRESCYLYQGNYIKNLSQLGRPLADSIIIDNLPALYIFHPQHLVPILSWFLDTHDNELLDILPILEDLAKPSIEDVSLVLDVTI